MIEERETQLNRAPSISSCVTEVGNKELERHDHGGNCDDDYLDINGSPPPPQQKNNEGAAAAEAINNCETESSANMHCQTSLLLPIKPGRETA